jgi:hypothetical protein
MIRRIEKCRDIVEYVLGDRQDVCSVFEGCVDGCAGGSQRSGILKHWKLERAPAVLARLI